ncbi:MAG: lysophospholipid acyltransferase family protein [Terriglobia bacterium]|jgi:1-acyl-sn-glycerol-3-phosphate acyltransferase
MLRAFLVTFITFAYVLIFGPPVLIYGLLSGNSDPIYRTGILGARMALWLAGVRLEVQGRERIPSGRPAVFMANHQSNCDPPALLSVLPKVLVLVKKEFFRVPVIGNGMTQVGFIRVDRKNREQALDAVERGVLALKAGRSFLVYPEGTRSPDGRLQPFKKGVFVMALKAGAPIVPVSVSGSNKIMPKGKFVMRPGRVRITVHDSVSTEGLTVEDREMVIERVRQAIVTGLEKDEWPEE